MIKFTPIMVHESSGMVSMRLFSIMLNEACSILLENVAKMIDIEQEFIIGYGQRRGIFEMADAIGIEKLLCLWKICSMIMETKIQSKSNIMEAVSL